MCVCVSSPVPKGLEFSFTDCKQGRARNEAMITDGKGSKTLDPVPALTHRHHWSALPPVFFHFHGGSYATFPKPFPPHVFPAELQQPLLFEHLYIDRPSDLAVRAPLSLWVLILDETLSQCVCVCFG